MPLGRVFAVALIALYCVISAAITITGRDSEGWYGWNLSPDGSTVIWITPGYPADKAGIRVGDRIDWASMPLPVRANAILVQPADTQRTEHIVVYHRGVARTLAMRGVPIPRGVVASTDISVLAGCIVIAIALGLVLLRPSRMTWGFLFSILVAAYPQLWSWGHQTAAAFAFINGGYGLMMGVQAAGTLMFASRFPGDVARERLSMVDRAAIPVGIFIALLWLLVDFAILFAAAAPPLRAILFTIQFVAPVAVTAIALACLATSCMLVTGSDRQRVVPVIAAYCVVIGLATVGSIYSALYTSGPVLALLKLLTALATFTLAAAFGYGVIKHRVVDVQFVISRTIVYTALTTLVVVAFAFIDFISSKLLEHFQITVLLEAAVALAFGVWLNVLHARIDKFIDGTFFRRRHEAEARLNRAGSVLMHADSAEFVDEALTFEPMEAFGLASTAVFRLTENNCFTRTAAYGWEDGDATQLTGSDRIIVHLRAELQTLDLSGIEKPRVKVPMGVGQPLVAIPLVVRHELLGFATYSGHRGGEALDSEEIATLRRLADAGAAAYDHIEAQALRRQLDEVRSENAELRHGEQLVRDMLVALRSVPRGVEG